MRCNAVLGDGMQSQWRSIRLVKRGQLQLFRLVDRLECSPDGFQMQFATGKSFSVVRLLKFYADRRPVLLTGHEINAFLFYALWAVSLSSEVQADTIHKVLGLRPQLDENLGRYILKRVRQPVIEPGTLIVVDEASMVDSQLLRFIRQAAQCAQAQVLFVGNPAQLPPIFEAKSRHLVAMVFQPD